MRLHDFHQCVSELDVVGDRIDHRDLACGNSVESGIHHVRCVHERPRRGGLFETVVFQHPRFTTGGNELMHDFG